MRATNLQVNLIPAPSDPKSSSLWVPLDTSPAAEAELVSAASAQAQTAMRNVHQQKISFFDKGVLKTSGIKGSCLEFREIIVFIVITSLFGYLNESIDEDKESASWEIPALTLH